MNTAFLLAAFSGSFLITLLLYTASRSWPRSYGKAIFVSLVALVIAVFVSAAAEAGGGPPSFEKAYYYLLAQNAVFILDCVGVWWQRRLRQTIIASMRGPLV